MPMQSYYKRTEKGGRTYPPLVKEYLATLTVAPWERLFGHICGARAGAWNFLECVD